MDKPPDLFDRSWEWSRLAAFSTEATDRPMLGVVSGRRRHGKSVLVRALAAAAGGFYWEAFEGSTPDLLADLAEKLTAHLRSPAPMVLRTWDAALGVLGSLGGVVALDELPYALRDSPEITSLLQRRLGSDRDSRTRWILCGSAVRVMGGLLASDAPLRGRAGLELVVLPFDFRTAREFWGIDDPALALRVFAVAGGTPAYAREFVRGDAPSDLADFDAWVCRTALDPSTPLFREGRILLAEEDTISDRGLYHGLLAAIAAGENSPARIAARVERPITSLGHALSVLADTGLVTKQADAFHPRRSTYEIAEPMLRFHHAVLRQSWALLERPGLQREVWEAAKPTFASRVVGPIFEEICRAWTLRFAGTLAGGRVVSVHRGVVNDPAARTQHEIDVVARDAAGHILAIGEARWGSRLGDADVQRLRRLRALLVAAGHDAAEAQLLLFSGTDGPHPVGPEVTVVGLRTLYGV